MSEVSQQLVNAQKELEKRRKLDNITVQPSIPAPERIVIERPPEPPTDDKPDTPGTKLPEIVKAYPTLLGAFLKRGIVPVGRVYQHILAMDTAGRGMVEVDDLRQLLTSKQSPYRFCTWKGLRQILAKGEGVTWECQRNQRGHLRRIRRYAPDKVVEILGCGRLCGMPIWLPVSSLLGGIQEVRAYFYAAFDAGRKEDNPITRKTKRARTAVPETTQRIYDKVAGTKIETNLWLEPYRVDDPRLESGGGAFKYYDRAGKVGRKGAVYLASRLPNSYSSSMLQACRGRQKKLNRRIDLVNEETRGNLPEIQKLFYSDVVTAGDSFNRDPGNDRYYRQATTLGVNVRRKPRLSGFTLWGCHRAL